MKYRVVHYRDGSVAVKKGLRTIALISGDITKMSDDEIIKFAIANA